MFKILLDILVVKIWGIWMYLPQFNSFSYTSSYCLTSPFPPLLFSHPLIIVLNLNLFYSCPLQSIELISISGSFCLTHHHRVVPVVLFCVWCCLPFINNPDQLITPELRAHLLVAPFVWFTPSLYSPSHTWLVYTSVCLLLIGALPLPYHSCLVVTCP